MTPPAQLQAREQGAAPSDEIPPPSRCRYRKPPSPADALQPVVTIRGRVPSEEVPEFIRSALQEVRAYINSHHLEVEGPPFTIRNKGPSQGVDVEAGWPVRRATSHGSVQAGVLQRGVIRRGRAHAR